MRINQSIPKPLRIMSIIFLSLWAIPVIWITVEGIGLWVNHIRLSQFGDMTHGVVVDTRIIPRRNPRFFLTCKYSPNNGTEAFIQEIEVSETIFEKTPTGTSVLVRYLPSDPEISNIDDNNPFNITGLNLLIVMSPMVLLTGLLIGGVYLSRRRGWL